MIRLVVFLAVVLSVQASMPLVAHANLHDVAPADEYFGPFKESILGIRNRLIAFERKADGDLVVADTMHGVDNIEVALEDWHAHYPRDPWLPKFLDRIVHVYARAHAMSSTCAHHAVAMLESEYRGTKEAHDVAALVSVAP